jgi:DNA-binding MarR family transcriptional regulator/ribosomal protein S18 acetylase RimI-like enzyme
VLSDIERLRRLNRIFSRQSGALDASFLGRGRPLNTARVLNAIAQGRTQVSDIRAYLSLDGGLLSRLLRSLEGEGLVELKAGKQDARRKEAALTDAGRAEFEIYEKISNAQAERVLQSYPDHEVFLNAVDLVACVLGQAEVEVLDVDVEDSRFISCMQRFAKDVAQATGLDFNLEQTASSDLSKMRPPKGACLLAVSEGLPIGCVALTNFAQGEGEVKRLWISPAARGLGVSKRLMQEIELRATRLGMQRLVLDTNGALCAALGLYRRSGWSEIERYNDNPYAQHFFEKRL